ncbi:hypothetical protein [Alloprevotella tannerae]|uniref:hypothetical protein n=1 Tax=Alloprevotella tannerae TaxID=76122 RepID=UPI0028E7D78D|nr:hypothetical protein [Alloprevotella tannerae]
MGILTTKQPHNFGLVAANHRMPAANHSLVGPNDRLAAANDARKRISPSTHQPNAMIY